MSERYFFSTEYFRRYLPEGLGWEDVRKRRAYLYKMITRRVASVYPGPRRILEIGCGLGFLSRHLAQMPNGPTVVAADISEHALETAKTNLGGFRNLFFARVDAEGRFPFNHGAFDVVVSLDIIEHLKEPERFASETYRVLSKGGVVILSTPNPNSFGKKIKEKVGLKWFGYTDDSHISIRSIREWRSLFLNEGFVIIKDGTDFMWDTPYFRYIPILAQKILFNGIHRIVTMSVGFLPWEAGEDYYAILKKD